MGLSKLSGMNSTHFLSLHRIAGLSYHMSRVSIKIDGDDMIKKLVALVLVLLAGGSWLLLDYFNSQELVSAEQMRQGLVQARAEAQRRSDEDMKNKAQAKAAFEKQILANLASCQAVAEKAQEDYMNLIQQVVPRKRGQSVIPKTVAEEAEKILVNAKADCQLIYDARLKNG
jgi:hypothetical protein